jgi:hypothetical protein
MGIYIEELKEAVNVLKKDGFGGENENVKAFELLISIAERVIEVTGVLPTPEHKSKDCHRCAKEQEIINACTLAIAGGWVKREDYDLLQERYGVLEKERDEFWSKAKFPDECYMPIAHAFKNCIKKGDLLTEDEIYEIICDKNFEAYGFSHEDVASGTSKAILQAQEKKIIQAQEQRINKNET